MRYVGDMLAWVHQGIAAEQEFLEGLFDMKSVNRMVGSVRKFGSGSEEEEWIQELLDLAVGKLCVPLKVRISRAWTRKFLKYAVNLSFFLGTRRCECSRPSVLRKAA